MTEETEEYYCILCRKKTPHDSYILPPVERIYCSGIAHKCKICGTINTERTGWSPEDYEADDYKLMAWNA